MTLYVMPTMPINFLLEMTSKFELNVRIAKLNYIYTRVLVNSAIKNDDCYICLPDELYIKFVNHVHVSNPVSTPVPQIKIPDMKDDQFIFLYNDKQEDMLSICRVFFTED